MKLSDEERRARHKVAAQRWAVANPERARESARRWYRANRSVAVDRNRERVRLLRATVIAAYGGRCVCCSDNTPEFLHVDHVYGGGQKHRRSIGVKAGAGFFYWLKKHGFPQDDFRLLCANCNLSLGFYGYCPHGGVRILNRPTDVPNQPTLQFGDERFGAEFARLGTKGGAS